MRDWKADFQALRTRVEQTVGATSASFEPQSSRRLLSVGLVVVLVVAAVALVLGVPRHSRLLGLETGHGWLTNDLQGQVDLANGETGLVDYRDTLAETALNRIEVTQSGNNTVVIDTSSGLEGVLNPGGSNAPVKLSPVPGAGTGHDAIGTWHESWAKTELLSAGNGDMFAIDSGAGEVSVVDPLTGRTLGRQYVGSKLSNGIVDSSGHLWVESRSSGSLIDVSYRDGAEHVSSVASSVVAPGDRVELASVNGVPAVVDESRALFFTAPGGVPGPAVSLRPAQSAARSVIAPAISGSVVPIAAPGRVFLVQGSSVKDVVLNGRSTDSLGAPVAFGSRIYVPDLSDDQVVILNDAGQTTGSPIDVHGPATYTTLTVQNGALFIDNADTSTAYSVTSQGRVLAIDKINPQAPTINLSSTNLSSTTSTTIRASATTPTTPTTIAISTSSVVNKQSSSGGQPQSPPTSQGSESGSGSTTTQPTVAATAPGAPVNPTATAGNKSASVAWTEPDPHGSAIMSYTLHVSPSCSGCSGLNPTTNSTTVTGLTNGTAYSFSVAATNAVGTGPSANSNSVTPSSSTPDAPTDATATAQNGDIEVKWTAANGEGHQISGYTVTPVNATGSTLTPASVSATTTSAEMGTTQGLVVGSTYTFEVTATNDANTQSAPAHSNSAVFSASPLAVTGLTAEATGKGTATVRWSCSTSCANGNAVTTYRLTTSPAIASSPMTVPATSATSYSENLTGLADATSYTVDVAAVNTWGAGQAGSTVLHSEGQPTASVSNASASGLSGTVTFSVNANGANVTGCALTELSGSATSSGSSCSSLQVSAPDYASTYTGTITIYSDYNTSGVSGATFSLTTGDKALDADASPYFGNCPGGAYCGANSNSCASTAFSSGNCPIAVAGGTTVYASCWTTGTSINNANSVSKDSAATASSSIWLDIPGYGEDPWMNLLWFSPAGNTSSGSPETDNLPQC